MNHLLHVILLVHLLLGLAADHQRLAGHLIADIGRERHVLDDDGCDIDTLNGDIRMLRAQEREGEEEEAEEMVKTTWIS